MGLTAGPETWRNYRKVNGKANRQFEHVWSARSTVCIPKMDTSLGIRSVSPSWPKGRDEVWLWEPVPAWKQSHLNTTFHCQKGCHQVISTKGSFQRSWACSVQSSDGLQKIQGTSLLVFITNKNNNDNDDNTIDTFVVDFNFCLEILDTCESWMRKCGRGSSIFGSQCSIVIRKVLVS